jgi:hypothetical protein
MFPLNSIVLINILNNPRGPIGLLVNGYRAFFPLRVKRQALEAPPPSAASEIFWGYTLIPNSSLCIGT